MGHGRWHRALWNRDAAVPPIKRRSQRDWIVMGTLALLTATQAVFLGNRILGRDSEQNEITVGRDLSQVSLERVDGTPVSLADGYNTLLLVFDPECVHSRKVAVMWKEWLTAVPRESRVLALSSGSHPSAIVYARDQEWPVEVVSVKTDAGGGGYALVRRAPWVYAIGGDGRVLAGGHGRKLSGVARALAHNPDIVMRYAGGGG